MLGGWGNTKIIIRRKQGANVIKEVDIADVLIKDIPVTFLVEITKSKYLRYILLSSNWT